jgi:Secretion system C-terminal sorting domain
MRRIAMNAAVLVSFILASVATGFAQNSSVHWYSFDSGFGTSSSSTSRTTSAVGQTFVGRSSGPSSVVTSGFLADSLVRGYLADVKGRRNLPARFELLQNYPNPFNPATVISYQLPSTAFVSLTIFDMLGRELATLVHGVEEPGEHVIRWDAAGLASGVYFYRLQAGSFVETRKMMVLR